MGSGGVVPRGTSRPRMKLTAGKAELRKAARELP